MLLVLDEQLAGKRLVDALRDRGLEVAGVGDFGVTGRPDPDVLRRIDESQEGPWVFVTMDVTIVEDHPRFDWGRYAIAWIRVHEELTGAAFERAKINIIQRRAHEIVEQGRGAHHTYTQDRRIKARPSIAAELRRRL